MHIQIDKCNEKNNKVSKLSTTVLFIFIPQESALLSDSPGWPVTQYFNFWHSKPYVKP